MSHFYTLVLVPSGDATDAASIQASVTQSLAPFDENITVPEYGTECYCVGRQAEIDAQNAAEASYPIDTLRETFRPIKNQHNFPDFWDMTEEQAELHHTLWTTHITPRERVYEEALHAHIAYTQPDPECSDCHGNGIRFTTYNPRSKWDWWVIGGRWAGAIHTRESTKETLDENMRPVNEILTELEQGNFSVIGRAICAPEGVWLERGRMGWFGMSSGDKPLAEWRAEVYQALSACRDGVAVGCDLHI